MATSNDVSIETEIRKYVKRTGGLRKGLTNFDIKEAYRLIKKAGRTKPEWDESIIPLDGSRNIHRKA